MAKSKKPNRHRRNGHAHDRHEDPVAHAKVIKAGVYDGSFESKDFVVSGHSTGAGNTEMEALSHQVSIDAGAVPAYPTDYNFRNQKVTTDVGSTIPEDRRDTKDMGGPDLYGPSPTLLENKSPLNETTTSSASVWTESTGGRQGYLKWGLLGVAKVTATAILGYGAYQIYRLVSSKQFTEAEA